MSAGRVIDYIYNYTLQTLKEREEIMTLDLKEVVVVENPSIIGFFCSLPSCISDGVMDVTKRLFFSHLVGTK